MFERVPQFASLFVRHFGAYGDLVTEDLGVARAAFVRRLWVSALLVGAILLFVEVVCAWVIAVTWHTPEQQWVLGALAGFFLVLACVAAVLLRVLARRNPGLLPLTAMEWEKDRRLVTELLDGSSSRTP